MIVGLFKSNYNFLIAVLFVIGLLLWTETFLNPIQIKFDSSVTPFYTVLINWFSNRVVQVLFAFVLVLFQSVFLNNIVSGNSIIQQKTFLPGLIYLLLMSSFPGFLSLNPVIIANLFFIFIFYNLIKIYDQPEDYERIFLIGFLTAVSSMFYFPAFYFLGVIWYGFLILRLFDWRAWVISLVGFITPYLFLMVYYFWFDKFNFRSNEYLDYFRHFNKLIVSFPAYSKLFLSLYVLLILFSLFIFYNTTGDKIIRVRNIRIIMIWLFVLTGLSIFLAGNNLIFHLEIFFIPASVFIANFLFSLKRKYISEIILTLLIAAIIICKFIY